MKNIKYFLILTLFFSFCQKPDLDPITKIKIDDVKVQTSTAVEVTATVVDLSNEKQTEFGFCYSAQTQTPTTQNEKQTTEPIKPTQTTKVSLTKLQKNSLYYIRFYVIENGTATYSEAKSIQTPNEPSLTSLPASNISYTQANLNATVNANQLNTQLYFEFGTSTAYSETIAAEPSTANGTETTAFTLLKTNLLPNTTYHYRAKAVNEFSTVYGENSTFTTKANELASITTSEITNITQTSATVGGNITADGGQAITERGVVWNIEPNPTLESNKIILGNGIGEFVINLTELTAGTNYFVRAYAINSIGIVYGEEKQFTTNPIVLSTLTTSAISNLSTYSATSGGNISDSGGTLVTARGVVWSTSEKPTLEANLGKTINGNGAGNFTSDFNKLSPQTGYFVRAYATNSKGTAYGNQVQFTTLAIPAPEITTGTATAITYTTATLNASVNAKGETTTVSFEYGTTTSYGQTIVAIPGMVTGNTAANVSANLSNLTPGTSYHFRVKATSVGGTDYGSNSTFSSYAYSIPELTTTEAYNITQTNAKSGGTIKNDGGQTIIARGVVWSTEQNPTLENNIGITNDGGGDGNFESLISNLTIDTRYYVRAYATNNIGTAYGKEVSFKWYLVETVFVQGGTFVMGCGTGQSSCDYHESPTHNVTLNSFYIGKYEVTQRQYHEVMGINPAINFGVGDNYPVYYVTWHNAVEFCNTLSVREGLVPCYTINGNNVTINNDANGYRLPTEAEWEYAARGGTNYRQYFMFSGSNTISEVAWYSSNSGGTTRPVGTKVANQLGIYDMSGNVKEWCWDWYGSYSSNAQTNPTGPATGTYHINRGGSWYSSVGSNADYCRVSKRFYSISSSGDRLIGLRVVRVP